MTGATDPPFLPGLGPEPGRHRTTEPPKHRAFLALKPDDVTAGQAGELALRLMCANGVAGKLLKPQNFHISLPLVWEGAEFPTDLGEMVSARIRAIRMAPFEIMLDMAMSFRQPTRHVLVLGTTRSVADIYALNRQLVMAMGSKVRGGSFNPHMTLLYANRPVEKQPVEPLRWTAREFVLIHSFIGLGRHEIVARWPLR